MKVSNSLREYFDERVAEVIESLPDDVRAVLDRVPLLVEDRPNKRIMIELDADDPDEVQGLYTHQPPTIHLFRRGLLLMSTKADQHIDEEGLRNEIRVTILHEVGHHRGMNEGEVDELGYG
ncbi:MAG: metallopeptidase family protein [Planctomycetota bacterium]